MAAPGRHFILELRVQPEVDDGIKTYRGLCEHSWDPKYVVRDVDLGMYPVVSAIETHL